NAVTLDVVRVACVNAGEPDQLPADLVAVAAIYRIAEEAFHRRVEQRPEEAQGNTPKSNFPCSASESSSSGCCAVRSANATPWALRADSSSYGALFVESGHDRRRAPTLTTKWHLSRERALRRQ